MRYVKTYEIFGWSKKEREAQLLKKQEEYIRRKREISTKESAEKKILDEKKSGYLSEFGKILKDYLSDVKTNYIKNITVSDYKSSADGGHIDLLIGLNNIAFEDTLKKLKMYPEKDHPFAEIDNLGLLFRIDEQNNTIIVWTSSSPTKLKLRIHDIINSKGDVSETSKVENISIEPRPMKQSPGTRTPPISRISLPLDYSMTTGTTHPSSEIENELNKIRAYIDHRASKLYHWIEKYVIDKINLLNIEEKVAAFNAISEDEVKEILSDILDLSNGSYGVKRMKDYYKIVANIPGIMGHASEGGMRLNKATTQVMRHIPEIQDRLNDIGLEMTVNFTNNQMIISISSEDTIKPDMRRPIRRAPR